ncbi:hypothetical protein [Glutamicibacter sp. BW77]|uniref:hypothetical protein n=1 Tax=Glutamicibacter TaxID=1742989 RepID=UPI00114264D4|nr:hypothetical protein [Glutamicibacter sp. BW77]
MGLHLECSFDIVSAQSEPLGADTGDSLPQILSNIARRQRAIGLMGIGPASGLCCEVLSSPEMNLSNDASMLSRAAS